MVAEISRPDTCRVKFLNYDGEEKNSEAKGLLATYSHKWIT